MWFAYKPVNITTPIGRGKLNSVQPSILGGPRSLVINGIQHFPRKGTHTHSYNKSWKNKLTQAYKIVL